jgi:hypothetical protein
LCQMGPNPEKSLPDEAGNAQEPAMSAPNG